jgi:uncharacterized OB-fold protein
MEKQEGEIYCSNCGKPIKKDFSICPYCRSEIKKEKEEFYNPETATEVQKPKVDNSNKGKSIAVVITVLLVVGIIIGFVSCCNGCGTSSTPTTESEQSKEIKAFVCSQTAVEKQLKSPSTAKFPYYSDDGVSVTKLATDKYRVSAYVDSQNSFGAMVRATYTVTITFTGEDTYKWEDVQIYE